MLLGPFTRIADAEKAALDASKDGVYAFLVAGLGEGYVQTQKRLHTFAPSDAMTNDYWLNGKRKPITASQRIADQNATPTLH